MRSGMMGFLTRLSMAMKATPSTTATASSTMVCVLPQPLSGAFEMA